MLEHDTAADRAAVAHVAWPPRAEAGRGRARRGAGGPATTRSERRSVDANLRSGARADVWWGTGRRTPHAPPRRPSPLPARAVTRRLRRPRSAAASILGVILRR